MYALLSMDLYHYFIAGYYLYTDASNGNSNDIAVLQSVRITSSPHQCLSFWYNMYGSNIGTLRVHQLYSTQVQQTPIWSMSGNKGREWRYQAINLTYQNDNYRILFEGVRGDGRKGDIAVDDIHISNTDCKGIKCQFFIYGKVTTESQRFCLEGYPIPYDMHIDVC